MCIDYLACMKRKELSVDAATSILFLFKLHTKLSNAVRDASQAAKKVRGIVCLYRLRESVSDSFSGKRTEIGFGHAELKQSSTAVTGVPRFTVSNPHRRGAAEHASSSERPTDRGRGLHAIRFPVLSTSPERGTMRSWTRRFTRWSSCVECSW